MKITTNDLPIWFIIQMGGGETHYGKLDPNSELDSPFTILQFKSEEIWKKHLLSNYEIDIDPKFPSFDDIKVEEPKDIPMEIPKIEGYPEYLK